MRLLKLFLRSGVLRSACVLLASFSAGCSDPIDPEPGPGPGPEPELSITDVDIKRYELKGEYDWDRGRLVATVDITLEPLTDGGNVVVLDSAVALVKTIRIVGGKPLPFAKDSSKDTLRINLSSVPEFKKGADITLAIDYEALPSDSFVPVSNRRGDPLDARTVFTMSEPLGARTWMPCHDTPADRAIFSIAMRMPDAEKMIANGDLVSDEPESSGSHQMKYETAYTLPTYLMAFAISDFEVKTTMKGNLPVSIWHRRGLQGHYDAVLGETVGMIDRFEGLLGPYPFEKYAVVHLPSLPTTGMENAGISFHFEGAGTEPFGAELQLTAHELAHQWFGDLMTIASWDDLWIKEGMASLLELEGVRDHSDKDGPFTLNGNELFAVEGEAIRDVSLPLADKYTSGPYLRAAWLLTQIRAVLGEEMFWKTLRKILDEHRFGVIGTDEFVDAFAQVLPAEIAARVKHAIDAKGVPVVTVEPLPTVGAMVTIDDPDGTLIAPIDIGWVAEDGSKRTETLAIGQPFEIAPKASGEFLVIDPKDHLPTWDWFVVDDVSVEAYATNLQPLLIPSTAAGEAKFLEIGASAQEQVLWMSVLPGVTPEGFGAFVDGLDSEWTKAIALKTACSVASDPGLDPQTAAAWAGVLNAALLVPPAPFSLDLIQVHGYRECSMFDPVTAFADDWTKLETGLASGEIDYMRLAYLSGFRIPVPLAISTWGNVAKQCISARARWLAAMELRSYVGGLQPADVPAWRSLFTEILSTTDDTSVLNEAIRGAVTLKASTAAENAEALAGLDAVLHSKWTRSVHWRAVCAAIKMTADDAAAWAAFVAGLKDAPLHADATARLEDPSLCP